MLDCGLMCLDKFMLQTMVTAVANTLHYHGVTVIDFPQTYARLLMAADSPAWHIVYTDDTPRSWQEFFDSVVGLADCMLRPQHKQAVLQCSMAPPTPRFDPLQGLTAQAFLMSIRQASLQHRPLLDKMMLNPLNRQVRA